ncbi:MAG: hypothetical protein Q8909_09405 [Bacteroidota bacterium]|nr:hypothetical protein [Bacteroidota bacterium]
MVDFISSMPVFDVVRTIWDAYEATCIYLNFNSKKTMNKNSPKRKEPDYVHRNPALCYLDITQLHAVAE